jgi:hypothetical protein
MYKWEDTNSTGIPMLIVAGDFDLVTQDDEVLRNIAAWAFDTTTSTWKWYSVGGGSVNGPVHAITAYDPVEIPAPEGEAPIPDPGDVALYFGGDFTNVGGTVDPDTGAYINAVGAQNIARFNPLFFPEGSIAVVPSALSPLGPPTIIGGFEDIGGLNDTVFALQVYNPEDPGDSREADVGPPALQEVEDPLDFGDTLFIGGAFTGGLRIFDGVEIDNLGRFSSSTAGELNYDINGTVFALTLFDPAPDLSTPDIDLDLQLVVAGDFTNPGSIAAGTGATASNIAFFGRVADLEEPFEDPNTDPEVNNFRPRLVYTELAQFVDWGAGTGTNDVIRALGVLPGDGTGDDILVVGGAFTAAGGGGANRIAITDGTQWGTLGDGVDDGEIRSIAIFADEQEPGLADDAFTIHIGGTFTTANGGDEVAFVSRFDAGQGVWVPLNTGVDDEVYAIAEFDDGNPAEWDRNDRPAARPLIRVSPTFGSFLNTAIRIYDSNLNVIYTNATVAPAPDPSGSNDPSRAPGAQFIGPGLFAGETYYIEVISETGGFRNTGRYNLTIQLEHMGPDINGDGSPDDPIVNNGETADAGQWTDAQIIIVDDNEYGDGDNWVNIEAANQQITQGPPIVAANGSNTRQYLFPRVPTAPIGATPSRFRATQATDLGLIHDIQDTDLYFFQSNSDGFVEVRINTTNLRQRFFERIWDLNANPPTAEETMFPDRGADPRLVQSKFDSVLRVFDNDLNEIAFNDNNPAVTGEFAQTLQFPGDTVEPVKTFYHRDARVVIPVRAGETYFIQVESGQKPIFEDPIDVDGDAEPDGADFVDWRNATGLYELLVNAVVDFDPDRDDDHANPERGLGTGTPIYIDSDIGSEDNGLGFISGVIARAGHDPDDRDADEPDTDTATARRERQPAEPGLRPARRLGHADVQRGAGTAVVPGGRQHRRHERHV